MNVVVDVVVVVLVVVVVVLSVDEEVLVVEDVELVVVDVVVVVVVVVVELVVVDDVLEVLDVVVLDDVVDVVTPNCTTVGTNSTSAKSMGAPAPTNANSAGVIVSVPSPGFAAKVTMPFVMTVISIAQNRVSLITPRPP